MKMIYNGTPMKSLNIKHYEVSTNDATLKASDLQSGVTAYAKGKKVTGTGKAFEFANYGGIKTNSSQYIPSGINIVEIASLNYPIKHTMSLVDMRNVDFTTSKIVGEVTIDGVAYPLSVQAVNNFFVVSCDKTITLQIFYGKDNYV